MKPLIPILAVAFAGIAFFFYGQVSARDAELAALRAEVAAMRTAPKQIETALKKATEDAQTAEENAKRLATERDAALAKAKEAPAATTPAAEKPAAPAAGDMVKGLADMFKGEEGKKMLKMQSEMGARMMYGDFTKKLDPTTADAFMALLAERQGMMATLGMELMNSDDPKAAQAKLTAQKDEFDKKLKSLVGEEKMNELTAYERTVGDRMMFGQVESQFSAAGAPLSPEQREGVIALMSQERLKTPASALEAGNTNPTEAMKVLQDDNAVADFLKKEEDLHNRVLNQANTVLSPDQVEVFRKSLNQMRDMQQFGLKMGKQMFQQKK